MDNGDENYFSVCDNVASWCLDFFFTLSLRRQVPVPGHSHMELPKNRWMWLVGLALAAPALVQPKTLDPCRHTAPKLGSTFAEIDEEEHKDAAGQDRGVLAVSPGTLMTLTGY
jgi:hypothetical protein